MFQTTLQCSDAEPCLEGQQCFDKIDFGSVKEEETAVTIDMSGLMIQVEAYSTLSVLGSWMRPAALVPRSSWAEEMEHLSATISFSNLMFLSWRLAHQWSAPHHGCLRKVYP